jgi:hypothetical protein
MTPEQIAQVCHEANAVYAASLGEKSLSWDEAKESAVRGVNALIADPSITPEHQHRLWLHDKLYNGWKYDPIKDAEKKTHPLMISYADLPEEQRMKDYLFQAIVRVLARLPKGYVTTI